MAASSLALADSAEELAGRDLAGHAIDAQPVETQRRFFQAHLMTQQQGLAAAKELVDNLTQAQGKKEFAADRTNLGEQLKDARKRLEARQERIRELQEKLARL